MKGCSTMISRHDALLGAAAAGACLLVGSTVIVPTAAQAEETDGVQYGFAMNVDKCVGCRKCVQACRYYNRLSEDTPDRRRVISLEQNELTERYLSTSCMHCAKPSCLIVCPAGAITKGAAGIVSVNKDRCIGCKYCYQACPFSVPHYNTQGMDKCDCCETAGVAPGDLTYCVRACMFGALKYGPIDDLVAEAGERGSRIEASTDPSCVLVRR